MNDDYQELEHQISLFRQWSQVHPNDWECDYDHWAEIWMEFDRFINRVAFTEWSQKVISDILYIIARDHEDEQLVDDLAKNPGRLLFVAQASLSSEEYDARWQLADRLGELTERAAEAKAILLVLVGDGQSARDESDPNEYTSRRALMALGRLKSPAVENLVKDAWATGYQYQRIAALRALYDAGSSQLEKYLQMAEADGSEYLRPYAARIRADTPIR